MRSPCSRPLARRLGKRRHHQVPFRTSTRWLSSLDVHDARCRYRRCQCRDCLSRFECCRPSGEQMTEQDIETILQRAKEKHPDARPSIITDNGPQFISGDYKHFIRVSGMSHMRTSPYYPQSNGKIERYHRTIKSECIRPKTPLSLDDPRQIVSEFVHSYNNDRLHSAIGYVTPADMLAGACGSIQGNL